MLWWFMLEEKKSSQFTKILIVYPPACQVPHTKQDNSLGDMAGAHLGWYKLIYLWIQVDWNYRLGIISNLSLPEIIHVVICNDLAQVSEQNVLLILHACMHELLLAHDLYQENCCEILAFAAAEGRDVRESNRTTGLCPVLTALQKGSRKQAASQLYIILSSLLFCVYTFNFAYTWINYI